MRRDPELYDVSQPFAAQKLMDGFELVEERQVPVDPDSPLGRAMAEARVACAERRAAAGELFDMWWQGDPVA